VVVGGRQGLSLSNRSGSHSQPYTSPTIQHPTFACGSPLLLYRQLRSAGRNEANTYSQNRALSIMLKLSPIITCNPDLITDRIAYSPCLVHYTEATCRDPILEHGYLGTLQLSPTHGKHSLIMSYHHPRANSRLLSHSSSNPDVGLGQSQPHFHAYPNLGVSISQPGYNHKVGIASPVDFPPVARLCLLHARVDLTCADGRYTPA
jgi:hypothetical protein